MPNSEFRRLLMASLPTVILFAGGCRSNFNIPASPAPTISASPGIIWNSAYITGSDWNGGTAWTAGFDAGVTLLVNGLPESTAAVTVSGGGGSAPLTYVGPVTVSGTPMAFYQYGWGAGGDAYQVGTIYPIVYQAGQTYILTTVTSAGTAAVTALAPGQVGLGSGSVTWNYEGNNDQVAVYNGSTTLFSTAGDANSPVAITLPTFDTVSVQVQQAVTTIPGTLPGSTFTITQHWSYWLM